MKDAGTSLSSASRPEGESGRVILVRLMLDAGSGSIFVLQPGESRKSIARMCLFLRPGPVPKERDSDIDR